MILHTPLILTWFQVKASCCISITYSFIHPFDLSGVLLQISTLVLHLVGQLSILNKYSWTSANAAFPSQTMQTAINITTTRQHTSVKVLLILNRRNNIEEKGGYKTTRICIHVHLKLRWNTQGKAWFLQTAKKCEKQFHNSPVDGMGCFCCLLSFLYVASHKATFGDSQRSRISSNSSYITIYTLEVSNPRVSYLRSVLLSNYQQLSTHIQSAIIPVTKTQVNMNKVSNVVQIHVYVYTFIYVVLWILILILISYSSFPAKRVSFSCVHRENIINCVINLWWHSLGVTEIGCPKTMDRLH